MKKILIFCLALMPLVTFARKSGKGVSSVADARRPQLSAEQTLQFDSLYFEALSYNLQGRSGEAVNKLNEALAIDSLSAPARFLRGKLMFASTGGILQQHRDNWVASCIHDLEVALAVDSANYWYGSTLAEIYQECGRYDLAIPCYERLARLHHKKREPHYNLAELYLRVDSIDKCLAMLDRIEEIDGINPNLTLQKFYILREQGKTDAAFEEYEKIIRRYPYDISYRLQLGDLQMKSGMIPAAKVTYDEAAKIDPDNAYLWIAQSNYYSITGNQAAADSLVQNALVNVNLDIDTKINILREYLKTTLTKVAKEKSAANDTTDIDLPGVDSLFLTVAAMHPTAPEVYQLHSSYLSAIGRDSLALVQMQFAVDLKPSDEDYWGQLLACAGQIGDYGHVLELVDEALKHHPKSSSLNMSRAYAFIRLEKNDSALAAYNAALAVVEPKEVLLISRIYGLMGDLCHETGDREQCYKYYEQSLKYNANNFAVLNNYAYFLCIDGGDLNKAESMAAKVVQKFPDEPTYLDTYAWIFYLQGSYALAKFYQQQAMDKVGDNPPGEMVQHYEAILKANNE